MGKSYLTESAPKPRRPLWPIGAALGALILIVAGVLVLSRPPSSEAPSSEAPSAEAPATVAPKEAATATPAGPRLAVDTEKIDFGTVKMNMLVKAVFKIKNVGSEPLQILGQPMVRVVEGC